VAVSSSSFLVVVVVACYLSIEVRDGGGGDAYHGQGDGGGAQ
jgi:hypothetical protein